MNPNQGQDGQNYQGSQGSQGYPPPPPNYPQPGPRYPQPSNQGFNLQDYIQRWQTVLQGRSVPTFDAQLPFANWQAIWIALAILGVVRGITGAISTAFARAITINGQVYQPGSPVGSFFGGLIGTFIGFFIGVGILYLIARAFNGTGTFLSYAYLLSLIFVPLGIASAVIGLLPVIGLLVGIAIGIFEVYLAILATAAAHRLPMDRATWVVLIPVIVGVVLLLLAAVAVGALLVALGLRM